MGKSRVVVVLACCCAIFLLQVSVAIAQTCGSQAGGAVCANNLCCSQYGYCGDSDSYCGTNCQSGPCTGSGTSPSPPPPPSGGSTSGVGSILSSSMFDTFFPSRDSSFYTYDAFTAAAAAYSSFGTSGSSVDDQKREVAAFCAHVTQETGGLVYVEEIAKSDYCDATNTQYPCAANKQYYGRGPLQISWNYNYGAASGSVGQDILSDPDLVANDSTLAFKTAFWFWTTASGSKPSCHDVMIGNWSPSSTDTAAGRTAGFGVTIDIINGGIECGSGTASTAATNRVNYYKDFCSQLGVDPGQNLDCTNMQKF